MSSLDPTAIVNKMLAQDAFSKWLGIEVMALAVGTCKLRMQVRADMLNGFGIAHGGITYSLADSALAFASNSGGRKSVSIETSIAHTLSVKAGDILIAEAQLQTESEKLGHYTVSVYAETSPDKPVALFKGMVYRTSKNWEGH